MKAYMVGLALPGDEIKKLSVVKGDRAFVDTSNGIMSVYVVMSNLTDKEIEEASNTLIVKSVFVDDISFLQLMYESFDFDMPFFSQSDADKIGNTLNIILVEENGYNVKAMRTLGLSDAIMENIRRCKEAPLGEDELGFAARVQKIFSSYTKEALFFKGATQKFLR